MRGECMPLLQVRDFPEDVYEEISNQERRRLAIKKVKERDIPEKIKSLDYIKLVREDRAR